MIKPDPEMGITITAEPTTQINGLELLEETFSLFGKFIKEHAPGFHIVLDEFQEITELRESKQIEGVLRSQIQGHTNVSYFFVGSRRRILLDIFNDEKRPFYKSAINYALGPLPKEEAVPFIVDRFGSAGKRCSAEIASRIYDKVGGYPYYLQRIPYSMYEISGKTVKDEDYERALRAALQEEKPLFQAKVERLYPVWKQLLYALSGEPVASPLSTAYLKRHNLSSPGSTQPALKNLLTLDYIEKREDDGCYHIVDPLFDLYLKQSVTVEG
ncbi:MAG: ATP-binding protein [Syntrophorhabdus aromaticivorans]|uniref:ATP-binding protein n=1 Tax=Syntrophorhabdus aromaticivorans TaxID=328301 RepID=A0A971M3Z4_9BACT|nr:ATP-binding protein [Syntrophorhabdus aromaticivorans]